MVILSILSIWLHFSYKRKEMKIQSQRARTAQKMKLFTNDFFSKCDRIRRKLRIWSDLLKKSFMENFIFCAVKIKIRMNSYSMMIIQTLKQWNYCWFCVFIFLVYWHRGFVFHFRCWKGRKQSFEIWYDVYLLLWNKWRPLLSAAL